MKLNKIIAFSLSVLMAGSLIVSCEKDDSEKEYGFSRIYMPQAVNKGGGVDNNYPVPSGTDSSTFNYVLNTKDKKIEIILGASLSGPGRGAYAVDVQVNNDTIQKLLTDKVFDPAFYMPMPPSLYTLPGKLEVPAGFRSATFPLSIDIAQLKSGAYAGKFLLLAVKLANASGYEVNTALSTTVVILDVNTMVLGPAVNVTNQYILNPGGPFLYAALQPGQTRWGNLKDWQTNTAARSHGGYGGYSSDASGTMNMESGWGSPIIRNGKIYQTITLPAGLYSFDISGGSWEWQGNKEPAYTVIAPNVDTLPDYSEVVNNNAIMYQPFSKPQNLVFFDLGAQGKVTLGVVVNYVQDQQGFKTKKVILYKYPKRL